MGYLEHYKTEALNDLVNNTACFLLDGYKSGEELNKDIENGTFNGNLYVEGNKEPVCTLRLEKGEGKYCIFEGSTWIVAWYDILSRFYQKNKKYFDSLL